MIQISLSSISFLLGNNHLGGQDFNNQLQEYLLEDIHKQYQRTLTDSADLQLLRSAIEAAKLDLTSHNSTLIKITLSSFDNKVYTTNISREKFESINKILFDKILEPIKAVLDYTELSRLEMDEIVMVGGSTRIPKVRQLIREYFDKSLNTAVDADLAVVSGLV